MMDNGQLAIDRYTQFLKNDGRSYWHFGVRAAVITVPYYYELGKYQEVVDLVRNSLLERYLDRGNLISKAAVANALVGYASSLTLLAQPEISQGLLVLNEIKRYQKQYGDLPESLLDMVNQQISHIESQIIAVGESEVDQARATSGF